MCIRAKAVNRLSIIAERIKLCSRSTTVALQLSMLPVAHEAGSQVEAQAEPEVSAIQCQFKTMYPRKTAILTTKKPSDFGCKRPTTAFLTLRFAHGRRTPPLGGLARDFGTELELRRQRRACEQREENHYYVMY